MPLYCMWYSVIPKQGKMIMQDKLEKERNDAKNNLEEYVYEMRDKLHGMFEKFIGESVSTVLKQSAAIIDTHLYTDQRHLTQIRCCVRS